MRLGRGLGSSPKVALRAWSSFWGVGLVATGGRRRFGRAWIGRW